MDGIGRRRFVAQLAGAALASASWEAGAQTAPKPQGPPRFNFEEVVRRARDLATAPLAPSPNLPEALARLDRSFAGDIKFRPERAFLATQGSRFRLQPVHLISRRSRPVTVNLIRDGIPTPIPYAASLFDFGRAKFDKPLPLNLGFAGFRLQFQLNDPGVFADVLTFSASSQFGLLGRGQRPGAALRALTVNAGRDNEEFPFFREFWIQTPQPDADRATIYGLLDGDSVTGAFRFDVTPGAQTSMDVTAQIFPRRIGGELGFAPISSMFLNGQSESRDFGLEAHSSDGLALHTGSGEWVWRPLRNPSHPDRFAFLDTNPRGFGLLQRERRFDRYQDLEKAYERRPGYWIEPVGDWGAGQIELTERPAADASGFNIGAAWKSIEPLDPARVIAIAYRVFTNRNDAGLLPLGRALQTIRASAPAPGGAPASSTASQRFIVDFAGGDLAWFLGDPARVEPVATISAGRVLEVVLTANAHIHGFRATLDIEPPAGQTVDIRLFLRNAGRALTETWTLPWSS